MHLANPAGLWALLGLVPVVALYILKQRATPHRVPSLLLWQRVQAQTEARRPFQRLKSQLLLWLQLLLVVLMAFALARPTGVGVSGSEKVLVFDLSASMQAVSSGQTRMELAKERALALLDSMADGDKATVLGAGESVMQLAVRSDDHQAVRAAISGLKAQNGGADMDGALSLALAMKRDLPAIDVAVFSDTWGESGVDMSVIATGESADNRSITSLRLSESDAGSSAYARVQNYGAMAELTLECYADGALCDLRTVELAENDAQSVRFMLPAGAREVEARIVEKDALAADDHRYAAAQPKSDESALLVTGGNVFLERALSLRDGLTVVKTTDAEQANANAFDLYIFDGKLPETLPAGGAVLAIAPVREVAGIEPQQKVSVASPIRAASGARASGAGAIIEHLTLADIALSDFSPLSGGLAALACGGQAALSVNEQDGRRAAVIGFDLHDSNLPLKADFPLLVQNLLGYLLPDAQAAVQNAACGDRIELPVSSRAASFEVLKPSGQPAALNGHTTSDTDEIGLYRLNERLDDGRERSATFAVHMPDAEADTRVVTASEAGSASAGETLTGGRDWTIWILLAWLCVLLLEWEVSRRGVSR